MERSRAGGGVQAGGEAGRRRIRGERFQYPFVQQSVIARLVLMLFWGQSCVILRLYVGTCNEVGYEERVDSRGAFGASVFSCSTNCLFVFDVIVLW